MAGKVKGRRYRVSKRRLKLDCTLWVWFGGRLTEAKGDPKAFAPGDLIRILNPGSTLWLYVREARR